MSLRPRGVPAAPGPAGRPVAATAVAGASLTDSLMLPRSSPARLQTKARSPCRSLHAQPGPRVDRDEHQVDDEVRDQDAENDEDEDALQQEEVLVADRLEDQVAEAGVLEGDLGDDVAADDHAELERETGELGQRRVAVGGAAHDPLASAERAQVARGVVLKLVDNQVSHADRPSAEAHEEHGEEGEEPVVEQGGEEGPVEVRNEPLVEAVRGREKVPHVAEQVR